MYTYMYVYIYIYNNDNDNNDNNDNNNDNKTYITNYECGRYGSGSRIRPISVLRFWISEGMTQAQS